MFDLADGIYIGTLFGKTPTQYVQFADSGINLTDSNNNAIVTSSTGISINGVMFNRSGQVQGNLAVTGNVISNPGAAQVTLEGHHPSRQWFTADTRSLMKTLLLRPDTWDLTLDSAGNIAVAENPYALAQDAASAIKLFQA